MNKDERKQFVKGLKKDYKDYEEFTANNGKDYVKFNLGEIKVPGEVSKQYLKVVPAEDGKNYLIFTLCLGLNDKVKQQRQVDRELKKQERQKQKEQLKQKRKDLKEQVKQTNIRLGIATKELDKDKVIALMEEKENLQEQLEAITVRRKKKD